jgi:hypothetical protein
MPDTFVFWRTALLLAAAAVVLTLAQPGMGLAVLVLVAAVMLGVRLIVAR